MLTCACDATKMQQSWKDLPYTELAVKILSLYISSAEVPTEDLRALVERSYSTFRSKEVVPLVKLQDDLHLLELFHGPSYSFKDCMSCRRGGHPPKIETGEWWL